METIKPKRLSKGNTIGIIAVSGRIKECENIEKAKLFFENLNYKVVISKSCFSSHRYMAGKDDKECINTFHEFFEDKNINAILCARGGYGTLRLLKYIDWNIVRENPKIFAGYSDITTLLNMIYKKTGLITFHSAMPNGDFAGEIVDYTRESFFNTLSGIQTEYKAENITIFNSGIAKGKLFGGNLATLASLCGTDFIPDENLILFLEDLNEPSYKIDRMLTQMFNIEKFKNRIKGIALGEFKDVESKEYLNEIIQELAFWLKIPVCDGFRFTHGKIKDTVPIGADAVLNAGSGTIKLYGSYTL